MNLGLLGAFQGLGQGLQQAGTTLFNDEIANRREQRLQAIRDKEYARNRGDQLADQQTSMSFQNDQRIAGQDYQDNVREDSQKFAAGESEKGRTFQEKIANSKLSAYSTFEMGKDGKIYGINSKGESKAIAGFEGSLVSFTDLTSLARSTATSLALMTDGDPGYADAVAFQTSLQNALGIKLQSSGLSDKPTPEFLSTLPRRKGNDGKQYVQYQGKTYLVSE
jgi:hypothetical protein